MELRLSQPAAAEKKSRRGNYAAIRYRKTSLYPRSILD